MEVHLNPEKRHDFLFYIDVTDGNPNGDPDAGNLPRTDPETLQGLMTDGCIKRKIRNWVDINKGDEAPYKIYVQNKGIALNTLHSRAYTAREIPAEINKKQPPLEVEKQVRQWMCENFYDVRTFGSVMTTSVNCGQVHGPMQIMFARSVDPIMPLDLAITRVAITKEEDNKKTEMGRKAVVPYGLYVGRGYYNPHFATQSGFNAEDLTIFWEAFQGAWDFDRSATRGTLALQGLYIYTHDNPRGNAPAHKLFQRITAQPRTKVPRSIADYTITVNGDNLPEGITLTKLVE